MICAEFTNLTTACASSISSDPKVAAALADSQGQEIHASAMESIVRHSADLPPLPYGASNRDWKRANRKRVKVMQDAVKADMQDRWKVYLGIGAGLFVLFTAGIGALVLLIVEAALAWAIEAWLESHEKFDAARVAMGMA